MSGLNMILVQEWNEKYSHISVTAIDFSTGHCMKPYVASSAAKANENNRTKQYEAVQGNSGRCNVQFKH